VKPRRGADHNTSPRSCGERSPARFGAGGGGASYAVPKRALRQRKARFRIEAAAAVSPESIVAKPSFTTTVLGRLKWGQNGWKFTFPLHGGRGRGTLIADAAQPRPDTDFLNAVRKYIRWFQRNDVALRAHIAKKMYPMWRRN